VPARYGVEPYQYIFVREVSNKSFNYYNQQDGIVCSVAPKMDEKVKVLLSLEDKTLSTKFPPHWTVLKEPVEDIHSLIYYSKLVVSSGDSMAREGAMLGVPSIYCGIRNMKANELLINMNLLRHCPQQAMVEPANAIISNGFNGNHQSEIRNKLLNEWDDMISFMMKQVNKYKKN
jgi:predicted glycosyltransferase